MPLLTKGDKLNAVENNTRITANLSWGKKFMLRLKDNCHLSKPSAIIIIQNRMELYNR